jgi:prophage regulatory protein
MEVFRNPLRLLTFPELRSKKGIPYTRQHLSRLEKAGLFPRRVQLSASRVAWIEDEVDARIEALAAEREAA